MSDISHATKRRSGHAGLHLVSVVWGDWYRSAFTDLLLPTLMAPGNIPALRDVLSTHFTIHTTRHDATQIRNSKIFSALTEHIPVDIEIHDQFEQSISTHHKIWQQAAEQARGHFDHIFFLPPDLVCSDGALRHLANLIAAGKRAIYCTAPRIVNETFRDAIQIVFKQDSSGAITAPARPLLRLMLSHYHPLNMSQTLGTVAATNYEEMLYWPVGDRAANGLISCSPIPGCFFVVRPDPDLRIDANQVIEEGHEFGDIEFVTESDDMLFLSILPLWQYSECYVDHTPLQSLNVAKTSLQHDSLTTQHLAKIQFRFRLDDSNSAEWRKSGRRAHATMGRVLVLREYLRARKAMQQNHMTRAAELIAYATHTLPRLAATGQSHVTIFVPSDDALADFRLDDLAQRSPATLARAFADHMVAGTWRTADFAGRQLTVKSLSGRRIAIDGRESSVLVDGAPLKQRDIESGRLVLHCVDKVLSDIVASKITGSGV